MFEEMVPWVQKWGYVAVFLGSMIEGESVILTASILAAMGYLSIVKVMMVAFVGTLFADQGIYFVGHFYGPAILHRLFAKFPNLERPIEHAFGLLKRWNTAYILTFRFIYGIRIISPVVIGAMGVPVRRFIVLNLIAAIIWTLLSCGVGYFLGNSLSTFFKDLDGYWTYVWAGGFILLAIIAWIVIHRILKKRRQARHGY